MDDEDEDNALDRSDNNSLGYHGNHLDGRDYWRADLPTGESWD
jgi:hypothetical protein